MTNKFSQYIIKHEVVAGKASNRICSFCHFDTNGKIAPYVVHYLKALKDAGCDNLFVSNNEHIAEEYLAQIRPYVAEIVLRRNEGYDFACYFTGYFLAKDKNYAELVFANDSVYGPFFALSSVFEKMRVPDMWGISDAYAGKYHIQSYFWVFKLSSRMRDFLNKKLDSFIFTSAKEQIVGMYEEGITQDLIKEQFSIGVLCTNKQAEELELSSDDTALKELKGNIRRLAGNKVKWWAHMAGIFNRSRRLKNLAKIKAHANGTGIFSNWYVMVKYMGCPFIKVGMIKKTNMENYHEFKYLDLIGSKYPSYDLNLIENHRKGLY
jgi:hypothetical protein